MKRILVTLLVACLTSPAVAFAAADDKAQDVRNEARERFDRALRLFEEGDNAGALAEFRRVHELSPNRLVLFNIGMVYAAMNRPVEAADTLEQVLKDPGPLTPDRAALAKSTLAQQQSRIAVVTVTTNTPAVLEVDGIELGRTPDRGRLRVPSGTHVIGALAPGYLPSRREVTVAGAATAELAFELAPSEASLAHVAVVSPVPGAEVRVDGALAGRTPLPASLAVPAGPHTIELRRPGFVPAQRSITLGPGAEGEVRLDLEEDPAAATRGTLLVRASESEATVLVNGRSRGVDPGRLTLPAGPHRLRLERPGFEPVEREVAVVASRDTVAKVTLQATPETRLAYVARVRTRRTIAWTATAAGGALAIAGGVAAAWAHSALPDARNHLTAVQLGQVRMGGGECDPAKALTNAIVDLCNERLTDAEAKVDSRKTWRTLGLVGAGVGLAAAAVGTYLLVTGEDVTRYDQPDALSFTPTGWAGPAGGGLGLAGRF